MTAAWAWLTAHGPAVVLAALVVLPALITALSRYPQTAGAVAALQVLLDVLSILTHRDSPGTLKLPLTRSQPPTGQP